MSKVYEIVTERIIKALEEGKIPWRMPWNPEAGENLARSLSTGKAYRGMNRIILGLSAYNSPWWGTYKQIQERGGNVRKGERSTHVVFWSFKDKPVTKNGETKNKRVGFLRYFNVFNVEQCEGNIKLPPLPPVPMLDFTPLERCEAIVKGMPNPPKMDEKGGGRCYYQPATDAIHMSDRRSFNSVEEWYGTLFHELIHATGHKTRTGRIQDWASKGSDNYAREELVAEIGSAFLRARAGIEAPPLETNSVAYIANWLGKLRNDPKLVVLAAGAAQKGADWVLGETFKTTEDAEPDEVEDEAVAEVAA